MNRLREEAGSDPTRARGVRLLRSMGRRENVPEMKQRVWLAVQRHRRLMQQMSRPARPWLIRRRPAFLAGLLLLSAATAGAMIGRRVVVERQPVPAPSLRTPAAESHHAARRSAPVALATPHVVNVDPSSPPSRADGHSPVVRVKERSVSRRAPVTSVVDRSAQGGNQILLDAMVALRRDRDPQRAGELLERFLNDFPRGALREEAMALSVEAASARNDSAGRDRWARTYLQAYPSGRFRDFVEGSLSAQ